MAADSRGGDPVPPPPRNGGGEVEQRGTLIGHRHRWTTPTMEARVIATIEERLTVTLAVAARLLPKAPSTSARAVTPGSKTWLYLRFWLVGAAGFEPAASAV